MIVTILAKILIRNANIDEVTTLKEVTGTHNCKVFSSTPVNCARRYLAVRSYFGTNSLSRLNSGTALEIRNSGLLLKKQLGF